MFLFKVEQACPLDNFTHALSYEQCLRRSTRRSSYTAERWWGELTGGETRGGRFRGDPERGGAPYLVTSP